VHQAGTVKAALLVLSEAKSEAVAATDHCAASLSYAAVDNGNDKKQVMCTRISKC